MSLASAKDVKYLSTSEYNIKIYNEKLNTLSAEKAYVQNVNEALYSMISVLHEDNTENQVSSPLAVFMLLGMLQEMADGETRQEILDYLGFDQDKLKLVSTKIYNELYCNTEMSRLLINNSAWFNEDYNLDYDMNTVNSVADNFYADLFNAKFSEGATKRAMSKWLKDNSDGAFGRNDDIGAMDSAIKLFSVVDFMARWGDIANGLPQTSILFKNKDGSEGSVDGLSYAGSGKTFYVGDKFTSGAVAMENGYEMVFVKPNDQFGVNDILSDRETLSRAISFRLNADVIDCGKLKCRFPLFNIESNYNLKESAKKLGMEKMFSPETADFGAILSSDNDSLFVSEMIMKAYIKTTKNGCKAGAMARADLKPTAGDPNEKEQIKELTLVLDKPFIFAIVKSNMPIFTGVVQNP